MTVTATQKIIKVGSSGAVTIPAKDMKRMGVTYGDELKISFEPVQDELNIGIAKEYEAFAKQYGSALKNLADR